MADGSVKIKEKIGSVLEYPLAVGIIKRLEPLRWEEPLIMYPYRELNDLLPRMESERIICYRCDPNRTVYTISKGLHYQLSLSMISHDPKE